MPYACSRPSRQLVSLQLASRRQHIQQLAFASSTFVMAPSATVTAVSNVATAPATSDKDLALVAHSAHLKPFGPFENLSAAMPWAVFPRKRLDLGFVDVAVALSACLTLGEQHRAELTERIQRLWDPQGRAFVGLSVRTGFDLLLQSLKFPEGSEVLVSGVEIADMQYVMRYHGLVPVPVDVKPDTLGINVDLIESKITPKTKMILVAHIYGAFNSMDAVIAVARKHNLLVAEDCAQIYTSIKNYTGHPDSDVAMFSFGTVKTATALGGGILRVNDERVLAEMRERESHYVSRTNGFFFKRAIKYGVLQSLTSPSNWGLFVRACHLFGHDHDDVITAAVRGFLGGELMTLLRKRPSLGLLALLEHRLKTSDEPYLALRKLKGQKLLSLLKDEPNIFVPGAAAENHVFWAFGVAVPDRQKVADYMNAQGFDVTAAATQLAYVNSPEGPDHDPFNAKRILTNVVYMPVTSETPDWAIEKMAKCLKEAVKGRSLGF